MSAPLPKRRGPRRAPPSRDALPLVACNLRDLRLSHREIAERLGVSPRSVTAAIRRAR